jgi:ABC-type cobalamin/Fe3+-siderophores transport system ATPase subunit
VRAVLALEHVSFGYHRGRCVLQDVSLQVAPGEVLALVGPNGVGKSTLLRLMAGLRRPWEGQLLLAGRDMALMSRREVARTVAVVPQEVHMPFPFTVRQVVELGRTPYVKPFALGGDHRDRTAVERALALLGLEGMAHRPFVELSGGERRRVIIAMALAQEPQLLLLDEPTAHLDIGHQVEVMGLLSRLAHEGLARSGRPPRFKPSPPVCPPRGSPSPRSLAGPGAPRGGSAPPPRLGGIRHSSSLTAAGRAAGHGLGRPLRRPQTVEVAHHLD